MKLADCIKKDFFSATVIAHHRLDSILDSVPKNTGNLLVTTVLIVFKGFLFLKTYTLDNADKKKMLIFRNAL